MIAVLDSSARASDETGRGAAGAPLLGRCTRRTRAVRSNDSTMRYGNGRAWGRPADILEAPDGSILVSDDQAGRIYVIRYVGR